MQDASLLKVLAKSFLAGDPAVEQIVLRCSRTLGRRWRWLRPLAQRYVKTFAGRTRPRQRDVIDFLHRDKGLRRARSKYSAEIAPVQSLLEPQQMRPVAATGEWGLPPIESPGALAEWLALEIGELLWFADLKGLEYRKYQPKLSHYRYHVQVKQSGGIRIIEEPKPRLKQIQRQILSQILDKIPVHPAVHGFVKGRSIKTFVTPHVAKRVVLRMDLQDFFPSFSASRIQTFFRTLGYPEAVADLLGGICTNATPRIVWRTSWITADPHQRQELRMVYSRPHLPQGAPTSPALANLCVYRVDCRLAGLARSAGAAYTRYADDLAFSGDATFERRVERFSTHVAAILLEEGLRVHHRKTRVMRLGVRQRLTGLVVNQRLNVARRDLDQLKAILTNCVRLGPDSQNREAHPNFRSHLEGRVGFVEMINPAKGRRLRKIFEGIQWQ